VLDSRLTFGAGASRVDITKVVGTLDNIQNINTVEDLSRQRSALVSAVSDLKSHLTDQETQISTLSGTINNNQAVIVGLQSQSSTLQQQVTAQQATIDQLNARLAATATAAAAGSKPLDLADSFRQAVDQIQAQARQSTSGSATTIRSLDIEIKGLVNVDAQTGNTVMVLPTLATPIDPNQLSTLRVSFAAIPGVGHAPSVTPTAPIGSRPSPKSGPSAPTVSSVSPNTGPSSGGTSVTLLGSGFGDASAVQFGLTAGSRLSVAADDRIVVVSPAGQGTVHLVVSTPGGQSKATTADQFTYLAAPRSDPPTGKNDKPKAQIARPTTRRR
jgi:IPT/TIG domain